MFVCVSTGARPASECVRALVRARAGPQRPGSLAAFLCVFMYVSSASATSHVHTETGSGGAMYYSYAGRGGVRGVRHSCRITQVGLDAGKVVNVDFHFQAAELGETGDGVLQERSQCEFKTESASYSEFPREQRDSSYCKICSYRNQRAVKKDLSAPNLQDVCRQAKGGCFHAFQWEVFLSDSAQEKLKWAQPAHSQPCIFCPWTRLEKLCMIPSSKLILIYLVLSLGAAPQSISTWRRRFVVIWCYLIKRSGLNSLLHLS